MEREDLYFIHVLPLQNTTRDFVNNSSFLFLKIPGRRNEGRRHDYMLSWCVCVCVCKREREWFGAAGGFHVPLLPARRLGQTSVTHTLLLSLLSARVNTPSLTHLCLYYYSDILLTSIQRMSASCFSEVLCDHFIRTLTLRHKTIPSVCRLTAASL